jgi:hypothetical protein
LLGRLVDDHVFDMSSTAAQYLVQGRPSIRTEMKTVGNLDGVRSPLSPTFGVRAGTIAHDDLDAGVAPEPVGEHVGGSIVEQIDWSVRLEIDEQRAVAAVLSA